MTRSSSVALLVVAMAVGMARPATVSSQALSELGGRWTLNRQLSQFPPEIGFGAEFLPTGGAGGGRGESGGGGRGGRRGSGGGGASGVFAVPRESEDDAKRVQQLTAEVRTPSARLTIVDTPGLVTVTDERGHSRAFHPDGKEEVLQLDGVPAAVTTRREAGRLSILYKVEQGRELRYTFSKSASGAQLVVDVQFLEHGQGDTVRRIYEPTPAGTPDPPVTPPPPAPSKSADGAAGASAAPQGMPASGAGLPGQTFNQKPDAELKGLKQLGVVVEDLSPQAAACGLKQGTLETMVAKRLTDGGFRVIRNSDEDSYVYININTASVSNGLCVSRYDVFFYTHTTATLSYQQTPVLVQVSLLHQGGIAGGAPAAHAEGVTRGVQEYLDQFLTRIRDANK